MTHKETIENKLREALRAKDSLRVVILRLVLSSISYKEVEKKRPLDDEEFNAVIKTMIKQHNESIEGFKKGQRADLVEKEEKELQILKEFAPEQISENELFAEIEEAINTLGAAGPKDMGKVMRFLMEKLTSRVDGKVLSEMVRKRLS